MAILALGIFLLLFGRLSGLRCHCDYHCPDNHENHSCIANYKCFAREVVIEHTTERVVEHGCIGEEGGDFQCRTKAIKHLTPQMVECCDNEDFCNEYLDPTIAPQHMREHESKLNENQKNQSASNTNESTALVISVTVCAVVLIIALIYMYSKYRQITAKRRLDSDRQVFIPNGTAPIHSFGELYVSSGTASGIPVLTLRSIAREITLYEQIGAGRFSTVHRGRWMHELVAVKTVFACDEVSLTRESEMFKMGNMNHDNILRFIGADIGIDLCSDGEVVSWIITPYHQLGSLYDFLQTHSFDDRILIRLTYSAVCGLHFIHRPMSGTMGKPAIAHRDIKSKNIYIKDNLQCCIGDLGLAVKHDPETKDNNFDRRQKLPTIRYMAPEVLEDVNISYPLGTYQKGDIYSFALVVWEILRRYEVGKREALKYEQPYYEYVENPTVENMKMIHQNNVRPQLPQHYEEDQYGEIFVNLLKECWHNSPASRLTALRVKKTLQKCVQDQDLTEVSGGSNSGHTASTGLS